MTASTIAGRYTRDAEIGRGGMGTVWRGTDEVLGRRVALKRIGAAPGGATPDAMRAEREARLAARLNDPHVVGVYDLIADDDVQWLVMEYVEGTDLADLIQQHGALGPDEVAPILAQATRALAAAHASGIVHRDVKPSNILVTPAGHVKLTDFGIARTQADAALTQTGLVTGSPAYLSPEVASGRLATPPSDVWSLGATLFHALEGHPPYDLGENLIGGLYRIVHEEPPRPARAGWLSPMLLGTMTHDPADRWTAAQVQTFLHRGPGAVPPMVPIAAVEPAPSAMLPVTTAVMTSRHRAAAGQAWWVVALAALVVVALGGWAVAVGFGGSDDNRSSTTGGTRTSTSPTAPASSTPSSAPSSSAPSTSESDGATPSVGAMTAFLSQYLNAVVSDQDAAFDLLTPGYQQRSGGLIGYQKFWGSVTKTKLVTVQADPARLTIDYTYRYVRDGKRAVVETHRMRLDYTDGRLLIADQT